MHIVPLTILDNFLDNPDMMRKFALSLPYHKDVDGKWPGYRTESLHIIDRDVYDILNKKFFSLFFDAEAIGWKVDARFQKIGRDYGQGWAHSDIGAIITGIVYLDPEPESNSGTIILGKNHLGSNGNLNHKQESKFKFYKGELSSQDAESERLKNNNNFFHDITIQSRYNRLIAFDSHLIHTADTFYGDKNEERLTLIFFVFDVSTTKTPIYRSKQYIL